MIKSRYFHVTDTRATVNGCYELSNGDLQGHNNINV